MWPDMLCSSKSKIRPTTIHWKPWEDISVDHHWKVQTWEACLKENRPTSAGVSRTVAFSNMSERVWRRSWYSSLCLESSDIFLWLANSWASLRSEGKYASDRAIVKSSSIWLITPSGPSWVSSCWAAASLTCLIIFSCSSRRRRVQCSLEKPSINRGKFPKQYNSPNTDVTSRFFSHCNCR